MKGSGMIIAEVGSLRPSAPDIFDLAENIQEHCRIRGFGLALPEELCNELHTIKTSRDILTARVAMNARIQDCLDEYQAHLIDLGAPAGRTPALTQDWQRFQVAYDAFIRRCAATREESHRVMRLHTRLLRRIAAMVQKEVV